MTNQCVNHTGINRTRVHISKGLKVLTHILPYFAIVVHCFPLSVVTQLSLYCDMVTGWEKPGRPAIEWSKKESPLGRQNEW